MCKQQNKNISGFSLIEVMVAFTMVTIAFIALVGVFPQATSINKTSENGSLSSFLAQQKIEEIMSMGYDNIATGTIESLHRLGTSTSDQLYSFERITQVSYVDSNLNSTTTDTELKMASTTVIYSDQMKKTSSNYSLKLLIYKN